MEAGRQMDLDDGGDFPELGICKSHKNGWTNVRGLLTGAEWRKIEERGDVDATPQRNRLQGWASVVVGSQESELEGCQAVTIDRSAVAGFYGGRSNTGMDYRYVFHALRKLWVNVSCPKFSVIGHGRFLVRVSSEEELTEVLRRKWVGGSRFLITRGWKPGSELRLHEEESIPLWIRLPQLPVLFWNSYSFKAIAQGLGASFVRADESVNSIGKQAGPSRFMFTAGSKESSPAKEKDGDLSMKEGPEQVSAIEGSQVEVGDVRQRWTRKSTRFASKGKKGQPPAWLAWKMPLRTDVMAPRREKRMKVIMERYHSYRYVSNAEGSDGVVRVLCVWKEEEMEATYVVADQNWVGVSFHRLTDNKVSVVFGMYMPPRFGERLQNFYQLEALVSRVEGPVMLIGDVNAMSSSQNKSGSTPLAGSCISFSRFIYACRLKEVEDNNKRFTWSNHRQGHDSVQFKLNRLRMALLDWNKNSFGNLSYNIANLQSSLERHREHVEQGIAGVLDDEHKVRKQLSQALFMEEVRWKQRSCIRWLAKGDKNTSFFHVVAKSRQAKRKIRSLECDGIEYVQSGQILEVCTAYFRNVLAIDEAQGFLFEGIDNIAKVTESENEQLLKHVSKEEVTTAM
ncbi:hypothetical protein EJ110_NYTH54320 [Nymphaea thermarum]|nr:hypothetical protein EJ110_NYTH54320 [Nymphaea thermarum]